MLRDTWTDIHMNHIQDNLIQIRETLPNHVKLMAVVKANGYGHGDLEAAHMAEQAGADVLAVAYLEEALRLRSFGIKLPILILTPIDAEYVHLAIENDLMLTVTNATWFKEMRKYKPSTSSKKLLIHVKVDTGLGRSGIQSIEEWDKLVPWLKAPDIEVDGFYTHFATAGKADTTFLELQTSRFMEMMEWSKKSGLLIRHYHCAGSAAALRFPSLAMDMVRIGAAMYGFYPEKLVQSVRLKPVMSLHSKLIQVKKLHKDEYLGYDNSYQAEEEQWIGTVPIGYADGWSQSMQNSEVLVNGQRAKVVGKICMDQLMVKLPGPCAEGTQVTLIGRQGAEEITFAELAAHIGSVAQEISTSLTARVTRKYKDVEEAWTNWGNKTKLKPFKKAVM